MAPDGTTTDSAPTHSGRSPSSKGFKLRGFLLKGDKKENVQHEKVPDVRSPQAALSAKHYNKQFLRTQAAAAPVGARHAPTALTKKRAPALVLGEQAVARPLPQDPGSAPGLIQNAHGASYLHVPRSARQAGGRPLTSTDESFKRRRRRGGVFYDGMPATPGETAEWHRAFAVGGQTPNARVLSGDECSDSGSSLYGVTPDYFAATFSPPIVDRRGHTPASSACSSGSTYSQRTLETSETEDDPFVCAGPPPLSSNVTKAFNYPTRFASGRGMQVVAGRSPTGPGALQPTEHVEAGPPRIYLEVSDIVDGEALMTPHAVEHDEDEQRMAFRIQAMDAIDGCGVITETGLMKSKWGAAEDDVAFPKDVHPGEPPRSELPCKCKHPLSIPLSRRGRAWPVFSPDRAGESFLSFT